MAEAFRDKNLFALPSRCLPLSHIKEMARGSRDDKIFRSPEKRLVLAQNTVSTDKGIAKRFPDRKVCLGHLGVWLLDTVDSRKLSILCKGMAEHLRDKSLSVRDPLEIRKKASNDKEMARGLRDVYFLTCASSQPCGRSRRFATECDKLRQCDNLRQNTANHGVPRQRDPSRLLADPTNETVPMGSGT